MKAKDGKISAGTLSVDLGVPERTIQRILSESGIQNVPGEGYEEKEAVRAIVTHYRGVAESIDEQAASDRARKNRAEADCAERRSAKEARETVTMDDYRNNYADAIAQGVQAITRLNIPRAHKEKVFTAIRSVKLPEVE